MLPDTPVCGGYEWSSLPLRTFCPAACFLPPWCCCLTAALLLFCPRSSLSSAPAPSFLPRDSLPTWLQVVYYNEKTRKGVCWRTDNVGKTCSRKTSTLKTGRPGSATLTVDYAISYYHKPPVLCLRLTPTGPWTVSLLPPLVSCDQRGSARAHSAPAVHVRGVPVWLERIYTLLRIHTFLRGARWKEQYFKE